MKRILSLFILVVALIGIIGGTIYILNHKGIHDEVEQKVRKTIEKVSKNETNNNISEIYNIYFNKERHKVKIEYQLVKQLDNKFAIVLYIYFDGKKVLERDTITEQNLSNIKEIFAQEEILDNVRINDKDFKLIKENDTEYLVVEVGSFKDVIQKHYYILNNNGDLIKDEGILVYDTSKNYMTSDNHEFVSYFMVDEEKYLARIDENVIYALEEKNIEKKLQLIEYKYYFKEGKLEKEKVRVYEDIKLKENAKK